MSARAGAAGLGLGALLLAALLGGCGDTPLAPRDVARTSLLLPPRGTVASITITGAPAGPLAVGATVQLTATARNSAGKRVVETVKWRSTDVTVARVSAAGLVTAVKPGQAAIIAGTRAVVDTATTVVVAVPATLTLSSPSPAMYVGQRLPLTVTALDEFYRPITGLYLAWTSSDPQKAAVDSVGKVTGAGAGPATITVVAGTRSSSVSLAVAARPVAEWSQAGVWGTFQGNARHTGFVAVSADPLSFRPLWEKTVAPGVPLNPVTAGDGRVFVTTNAYFGTQVLSVFDAQTGGEQWKHVFEGFIHGVHPPAYGGGRVYVTTSGHGDSFLWGFDASNGTQRVKSPYGNQWSRYFAPVVADGRVYMAGGSYGGMYAFRTDGGLAWFVGTNQYDEWTPAVDGGLVYAYTGAYSPALSVVNAATGALAYEIPDPHFSWNGWSMSVAPVLGALGNVLATQAGRLISFDLAGRRIGWELAGQFAGGVTVADGVLYVVNDGHVEARRESNGTLLWSWTPPFNAGPAMGTTVVTRNLLFVSTYSHTYAVDLSARQHTWSYPAGGHLALSGDGVLLIAQPNGNVAAIGVR